MKTNLEDLKKFTKNQLIMRVEKLENSNARLISEVQELLIETTQKTLNEVSNYRQIKIKYISPTNFRGSRLCIYEPKRYNADKTKKVYLSYDYSIGCIQEQAFKYLQEKGFKIVAKASEFENYIFFADNWADEFRELKTGKIRTY